MTRQLALPGLDASRYQRHALHADDRIWVEKNCYVDVCIELLHALSLEPLAMLGSCAEVDFLGDNFTFYKPLHEDLRELYGVDVQELNVWLPLVEHATRHLGSGTFLSTEADAFLLPDTRGTDYQRQHVKTTIVLADLDVDARRLGYFHNAGYFELEGDDFDRMFRMHVATDPMFMPFYAELVRVDRLVRRADEELVERAIALLSRSLARRPSSNPIDRFQREFELDLPRLQETGLDFYHVWAFATVRQMGAVFELLSLHLKWLDQGSGDRVFGEAAVQFEQLSVGAKALILKAARAVNGRKPFDASSVFRDMSQGWEQGMAILGRRTEQAAMAFVEQPR